MLLSLTKPGSQTVGNGDKNVQEYIEGANCWPLHPC